MKSFLSVRSTKIPSKNTFSLIKYNILAFPQLIQRSLQHYRS